MKRVVLISVYMNNKAKEANKPTFRRELVTDSSLTIPYGQLVDSFKVLFGDSCLVTFEIEDFKTFS